MSIWVINISLIVLTIVFMEFTPLFIVFIIIDVIFFGIEIFVFLESIGILSIKDTPEKVEDQKVIEDKLFSNETVEKEVELVNIDLENPLEVKLANLLIEFSKRIIKKNLYFDVTAYDKDLFYEFTNIFEECPYIIINSEYYDKLLRVVHKSIDSFLSYKKLDFIFLKSEDSLCYLFKDRYYVFTIGKLEKCKYYSSIEYVINEKPANSDYYRTWIDHNFDLELKIDSLSYIIPFTYYTDDGRVTYNSVTDDDVRSNLDELKRNIKAHFDSFELRPISELTSLFFQMEGNKLVSINDEYLVDGKFVLPPEVEIIEDGVFNGSLVKHVVLNSNIKVVKKNTFSNCPILRTVDISEGATEIESAAFINCEKLENVTIPKSVTRIGCSTNQSAFINCPNISFNYLNPFYIHKELNCDFKKLFTEREYDVVKIIVLDYNSKFIPKQLAKNIKKITYEVSDSISFEDYIKLLEVFNKISFDIFETEDNPTSYGVLSNISINSKYISFPKCVIAIGDNVRIPNARSVYISLSVEGLSPDFLNNNFPKKVTMSKKFMPLVPSTTNIKFNYLDNKEPESIKKHIIISKNTINKLSNADLFSATDVTLRFYDETILNKLRYYIKLKNLIIDFELPIISEGLFSNFVSSGTINFKYQVEQIMSNAFSNSNITAIKINTNLNEIGDYAFSHCTNLKSLKLDGTINKIGKFAFNGCKLLNLNNVIGNASYIGDYAFSDCEKLTVANLNNSLDFLGECAFKNCINLIEVNIPEKLKEIKNSVFENCTALQRITGKTNRIGSNAFKNCKLLELNDFITDALYVGDYAFSGCEKLTVAKLNEELVYLGEGVFENCISLTKANLPPKIKELKPKLFYNSSNLKTISGIDHVEIVNSEVFFYCSSLKSLTFSPNLTCFWDAINGCKSLESIIFTASLDRFKVGEGCKDNNVFFVPKVVEHFEFESKGVDTTFSFIALRGSNWIPKKTRFLVKYITAEEYSKKLNMTLYELGIQVMDDPIKFSTKIRKNNQNTQPTYANTAYKRAEWDTTIIKEEDTTVLEDKPIENINYILETIDSSEIVISDSIDELNSELITCDELITSLIIDVSFSNLECKDGYCFIYDIHGNFITNVVKISNINQNDTINLTLDIGSEYENCVGFVLLLDDNKKIIASKKVEINRMYDIESLLDF